MVGAFIVEIFMEKIPYLNMYKNQADYNKISKSNKKYVILYKIMLQGDGI